MRAIVSLKCEATDEMLNRIGSEGGDIVRVFKLTHAMGLEIEDQACLDKIGKFDFVVEARRSRKVKILIDNAIESLQIKEVLSQGIYGDGVSVSIVDSGMNFNDPNVAYSVIATKDFTGEGMFDAVGYGGLVTGLVRSAAPGASFLCAKIIDGTCEGDEMDLISAIEWSCDLGADVINVSSGISRRCPVDCVVCQTVNAVVEQGITVVAAAGNDGPTAHSINCPGNAPRSLTVGGVDGNLQLLDINSRVDFHKPDFVAPGQIHLGGWVVLGTSISAPFVSGIVALLMSRWGDRDKIVKALKETAKDLGYERREQGYGLVQATNSVRRLTCAS